MDNKPTKNYSVAKESDGTIQITFTIAKDIISKNEEAALTELGKDMEVSGFRKGKAPLSKVKESVAREKYLEKTLSGILPQLVSDAIQAEKIKPSIYPRFELVSAEDGRDWQVRAVLCEIPTFELGDYKSQIKKLLTQTKIWTPDSKDNKKEEKEPSRMEKEQKIIDFLLGFVKVTVPRVLIDEEVNSRLSQLLARIEKLGLTLEGYLKSIGKEATLLREEYAKQSENAIKVELILEKIGLEEKLKVTDKEIDEAISASSNDPNASANMNLPEQRGVIRTILLRRKALDSLLTIV